MTETWVKYREVFTFVASRTKPTQLAVALLPRRRCGLDVDTFSMVSTITVLPTLISILATVSIVESITFAATQ